jgi:hypothetical protein
MEYVYCAVRTESLYIIELDLRLERDNLHETDILWLVFIFVQKYEYSPDESFAVLRDLNTGKVQDCKISLSPHKSAMFLLLTEEIPTYDIVVASNTKLSENSSAVS